MRKGLCLAFLVLASAFPARAGVYTADAYELLSGSASFEAEGYSVSFQAFDVRGTQSASGSLPTDYRRQYVCAWVTRSDGGWSNGCDWAAVVMDSSLAGAHFEGTIPAYEGDSIHVDVTLNSTASATPYVGTALPFAAWAAVGEYRAGQASGSIVSDRAGGLAGATGNSTMFHYYKAAQVLPR